MSDLSKINPAHTQRAAYIYIRQSSPRQVEHNRESTARQYGLADRACQLVAQPLLPNKSLTTAASLMPPSSRIPSTWL